MMFKILIIEDEKPLLDKMVNNINWQKHGYQIFQAVNGLEALSILQDEDIDILVTDIQMPGLNGIELVNKLREDYRDIKVLIISGHAEFEYAQQLIRLGVNEYLLKPFRSQRLLEAVNEIRDGISRENKDKEELASLRDELSVYLNKNVRNDTLNWLTDDKFFENQSIIINNNQLYQLIKTGSEEELLKEVDHILKHIGGLKGDRQGLFILLNNLVLFTFQALKELGYDYQDMIKKIDNVYLEKVINGDNLLDLEKWLKDFFLDVNSMVTCPKNNQNEILIEEVKEHIKKNYQEGITLTELSQHFNVSSGYLSKLFLDYVGENFTDYLNMIRVNKAKELLKTTDKKIYQIADEIGFNDSFYFSSWFKRLVGVTPTTYRDNLEFL
ncbi:response regulator [Halocella sp. SP3-1]|uniref:response regulator transcription factor n=1 Tax=Halocella sp. SP3-1 TaxID=2382161 RepID=UPI000F752DC8|nr:response regulator [Halocella sp. SP3-1]AZO96493.1 response regulator [Halocella sp. SP3-1]